MKGSFSAEVTEGGSWGDSLVLESPDRFKAVYALSGCTIEELRFHYPGGTENVIRSHDSILHLKQQPSMAGGTLLAPIYNRVKEGLMHILVDPDKEIWEVIRLKKNFPFEGEPRDAIHGSAMHRVFEVMDKGTYSDSAYGRLRYITREGDFGDFPAGVEYIVTPELGPEQLLETIEVINRSEMHIPGDIIGRHTNIMVPFRPDGNGMIPVDEHYLEIEASGILEIDEHSNPTGGVESFSEGDSETGFYDFRKARVIGSMDIDRTYVMQGKGSASLFNKRMDMGVKLECGDNIRHVTVWTNREAGLIGMEPGNHAGACNSMQSFSSMNPKVIGPGESITLKYSMKPFYSI